MGFADTILAWYRENGRALPWRETRDAYAIWLSEIILQQTRIAQGKEYWERFMAHYPRVEDLASASEDEVLKLWQGLGYYSRARNLHAAAKQIVALGKFPDTLEGIRALKGVGDYTAAAIGSFAFGIPAAVLDGNVYRVLARYFGIETPINSTPAKKEFSVLAQSLLDELLASHHSERLSADATYSLVADYNQGMMDFGAVHCTPKSPMCMLCPLAETCVALRTHQTTLLPIKEKKLTVKTRHLTYVYIRCHGEVAIHRRGEGDIWQGLWEPFNASIHEEKGSASLAEILDMLQLSGKTEELQLRPLAKKVKHVLTHRILLADFYLLEIKKRPLLSDDYIWIKESELSDYGIPRLIEILLEKL